MRKKVGAKLPARTGSTLRRNPAGPPRAQPAPDVWPASRAWPPLRAPLPLCRPLPLPGGELAGGWFSRLPLAALSSPGQIGFGFVFIDRLPSFKCLSGKSGAHPRHHVGVCNWRRARINQGSRTICDALGPGDAARVFGFVQSLGEGLDSAALLVFRAHPKSSPQLFIARSQSGRRRSARRSASAPTAGRRRFCVLCVRPFFEAVSADCQRQRNPHFSASMSAGGLNNGGMHLYFQSGWEF